MSDWTPSVLFSIVVTADVINNRSDLLSPSFQTLAFIKVVKGSQARQEVKAVQGFCVHINQCTMRWTVDHAVQQRHRYDTSEYK